MSAGRTGSGKGKFVRGQVVAVIGHPYLRSQPCFARIEKIKGDRTLVAGGWFGVEKLRPLTAHECGMQK